VAARVALVALGDTARTSKKITMVNCERQGKSFLNQANAAHAAVS